MTELGKELGEGHFGKVYAAKYPIGNVYREGALKISKQNSKSSKDVFLAQLNELKIMVLIGKHENIVTLLGASTNQIEFGELQILMELCSKGCLRDFLLKLQSGIEIKKCDDQSTVCESHTYSNILATPQTQSQSFERNFGISDLKKWSYQIANAMLFLQEKNVSHCDLATRNILLTENYDIKISDFGMSIHLSNCGAYQKKGVKDALPWRWMAIESLTLIKFSLKSDVWSYGVTLWEIFSLAQVPYSGILDGYMLLRYLNEGKRLERPDFASHKLYTDVMKQCWNSNPDERPTFHTLKMYFSEFTPELE